MLHFTCSIVSMKIDEIMEKVEIIVNEMMVDDGPVPVDL